MYMIEMKKYCSNLVSRAMYCTLARVIEATSSTSTWSLGSDGKPRALKEAIGSEGTWLSGRTLDRRPRDCQFDPPHPNKISTKEICTSSSKEKGSRALVLDIVHVKEAGLSCVVGAPESFTLSH